MTPAGSKTIREETLADVPAVEIVALIKEFVAADAVKVSVAPQDGGMWTLVATFEAVTQ